MKKSALVVIDMQVGATELPGMPIYRMEELVQTIAKLLSRARQAQIPVVYAQHYNPDGFPEYGSDAWQLIPAIQPLAGEKVVHKTTPDLFLNTSLHEELQQSKVERLIIAGIQSPYCIDTTCRRAYSLGYEVNLVKDGHSTFDSPTLKAEAIIEHHNQIIADWFGQVVAADEVEF
jgi:nicotinamidase-related amidase